MASRSIRSVLGLLATRLPRSAVASPTASLLTPVFVSRAASQPVLALVREFRASAAPQTANLAKVLKDELTYEQEEYEQAPEVTGGPPNGFTLTESQGDRLVALSKENGPETITVELVAGSEEEDEDAFAELPEDNTEQEGEEPLPYPATPFSVSVAKGDSELRFELRVRGDGTLQVDEVELNVDGGDESAAAYSEVPYLGPAFDELDEGLQAELMHFLDARGVNGELAAYLTAISFDKEQREYTAWLERMHKFVTSN